MVTFLYICWPFGYPLLWNAYSDPLFIFTLIGCLCVLNLLISLRRHDIITILCIVILYNIQYYNIPVQAVPNVQWFNLDLSTLWWCTSHTHSIETVLWILTFDLRYAVPMFSHDTERRQQDDFFFNCKLM